MRPLLIARAGLCALVVHSVAFSMSALAQGLEPAVIPNPQGDSISSGRGPYVFRPSSAERRIESSIGANQRGESSNGRGNAAVRRSRASNDPRGFTDVPARRIGRGPNPNACRPEYFQQDIVRACCDSPFTQQSTCMQGIAGNRCDVLSSDAEFVCSSPTVWQLRRQCSDTINNIYCELGSASCTGMVAANREQLESQSVNQNRGEARRAVFARMPRPGTSQFSDTHWASDYTGRSIEPSVTSFLNAISRAPDGDILERIRNANNLLYATQRLSSRLSDIANRSGPSSLGREGSDLHLVLNEASQNSREMRFLTSQMSETCGNYQRLANAENPAGVAQSALQNLANINAPRPSGDANVEGELRQTSGRNQAPASGQATGLASPRAVSAH